MNALLEVRGINVLYRGRGRRKDKVALDDVSVSVGAGETLGLVGESGSGKSTLGNCVLGLVQPTGGTITFDGRDITRSSRRERRALGSQIQAVFQDPYSSFNPHRTIEQSVSETLATLPSMSRSDQRARVTAMLERVGLDGSALSKFPAQFSGGQRQRIAIARALLPEPRLMVCDESVSALDLSVQAQILNLLLELQRERGVAYLFITHDLAVVEHMSTRVAVLQHGRLVEEGEAAAVTGQPTQQYTRRLVEASLTADADVQQARRDSRRALAGLTSNGTGGGPDLGDEVLLRLEHQAVTEALTQARLDTSSLKRALDDIRACSDVPEGLEGLRAAVTELSPRTSEAALTPAELASVEAARKRRCDRLSEEGQEVRFVDRVEHLAAAIDAGDRKRAKMLVSSLDDRQEREATTVAPTPTAQQSLNHDHDQEGTAS